MILSDRVDEVSHVGDPKVSVADLRQSRPGARASARLRGVKGVNTTVRAVGEHDKPVVNRVGFAAVLVDSRADIGQSDTVDQW